MPISQYALQGWRQVMGLNILIAASILIANIVILNIANGKEPNAHNGNVVQLYSQHGTCEKVKTISRGAHIAINIVSSMLLTASLLCIQVLLAPTREEVDKAHASGRWLHIGIGGLRNTSGIAWKRTLVALVCFLSSVPLHMV